MMDRKITDRKLQLRREIRRISLEAIRNCGNDLDANLESVVYHIYLRAYEEFYIKNFTLSNRRNNSKWAKKISNQFGLSVEEVLHRYDGVLEYLHQTWGKYL